MFLLVYTTNQSLWYFSRVGAFAFVFATLIELIRFVEKYNRSLNQLLLSIKHKDFTKSFDTSNSNKSSAAQQNAFEEIINAFQNVRIEKETQLEFLQALIEHMTIGIICLEGKDSIYLINSAAKKALNTKLITHIRRIERLNPELYSVFKEIKSTEKKTIKTNIGGHQVELLVWATELILKGKPYKIISFQNIKTELDKQELDSWQKLIRILNHEIMNSVTPISSLSTELNEMLQHPDGAKRSLNEITEDEKTDIYEGLESIERRSKGLLKFVKTYKSIARLPKPKLENIKVNSLLHSIITLMEPEFSKRNISVELITADPEIMIRADGELLEQVLINLILNARDAVEDNATKEIKISMEKIKYKTSLKIMDNGCGIQPEFADQVFVPFFTTKKSGSGIGLSLSRQIVSLHGGSIHIDSTMGSGTTVEISI